MFQKLYNELFQIQNELDLGQETIQDIRHLLVYAA